MSQQGSVHPVLSEMGHKFTWDEELFDSPESQNSLLDQLAWFGGDSVDEEWKPIAELATDDKLTYASDSSFFSELGMNFAEQVCIEMQNTVVVWDEEISFHLGSNDDLLHRLMLGGEFTDEKIGLIVELDAGKMLIDVNGLSKILVLDEISDAMSHQLVCNQHGHSVNIQQTLEPSVLDCDKLDCEMFIKANGNLQLEERVVGLGTVMPSARCVMDHFSPGYNQHLEHNFFLVFYGAYSGYHTNCTIVRHGEHRTRQEFKDISLGSYGIIGCVNSKIRGTGCVFKESPSWRRSAFDPGKYRIEADCSFLGEMPSWQQGGFRPWSKGAMSQELINFAENERAVFFCLV
ncbi:hypothetical protein SETIT_5G441800v2 [Setaria italica]|uniref:Uncharacterized protein n=1 Tax=Setaria italica TaxID=4555 RepID=A0A368RFD8_SETIT|nr:hypothetical protein SETIT_5G441800v2 [Setaria italica]